MEYFWILCLVVVVVGGAPPSRRPKSQRAERDNLQVASSRDLKEEATGYGHGFGSGDFGHSHGGHGKYFQYAHNPDYGTYEFGYRRGNDYHFQERYEKAQDWKFKTKVKWGDKYGGYGEHYWDYNHADKGYNGPTYDGDGHYGGHDDHGHGHYSEQVPVVSKAKVPPKNARKDRAFQRRASDQPRIKTVQSRGSESELSLDLGSGKVTDERTGRTYWLQPSE